ncbi:hypothetical protein SD457_07540 [Coprobacillaceae bacterium CR2/5/TPMF4]|nr:hypothetical protein SD457_07540 [Coprobacillaceae bacterium CR2/5/TPMF4]
MFSLEGYFAPETYIITASNTTIEDVTEMMLDQTDKNLSKYKDKIASFTINGNPVTMHQFLTFASNSTMQKLLAIKMIKKKLLAYL